MNYSAVGIKGVEFFSVVTNPVVTFFLLVTMFLEPENLTRGSLFPSWFFFTSKTTFKLLKSYKWEWGLDRLLGRSLPGPEKLSA